MKCVGRSLSLVVTRAPFCSSKRLTCVAKRRVQLVAREVKRGSSLPC